LLGFDREELPGCFHGHISRVDCLAFRLALAIVVLAPRDSVAGVWDIHAGQAVLALEGHARLALNAIMEECHGM
jgi:hypothetical protein